MAEHYPQSTTGVLKWCNTCGKKTIHAVSGKRIGRCVAHSPEGMSKKQEAAAKKRAEEEANPKLF